MLLTSGLVIILMSLTFSTARPFVKGRFFQSITREEQQENLKRKKSQIYKLEGAVYTLRNQQLALLVRNIVDMLLTKVVCLGLSARQYPAFVL